MGIFFYIVWKLLAQIANLLRVNPLIRNGVKLSDTL